LRFRLALILITALSIIPAVGLAGWQKYPANPVLDVGEDGSWSGLYVSDPCVLFDGEMYHMWYVGDNGSMRGIGYATSSDGVNWQQYPGNPVLKDGIGDVWDGEYVSQPTVLYYGNMYHMWYTGYDGEHLRIGYAVSTDGINWQRCSYNPVLDVGPPGEWDSEGVSGPTVLIKDNAFQMWYTGYDGEHLRIGYATSSDGISWQKSSYNPVLDVGTSGEWDDEGVSKATVLYHQDQEIYRMWYAGYDGSNVRIGYATSSDGISWSKHTSNPILDLGPDGTWDSNGVSDPTVVFNPNTYHMWYTGYDGSNMRIGYAFDKIPGDTSGDGTISAYDAGLILQFVVGLIDEFPAEFIGAPDGVNALPIYKLSMPQIRAKAGEVIHVPLNVEDGTGLYAGGIRVKYDPSVLRALDVSPLTLLSGSYWQGNVNLRGEIRFAFITLRPIKGGGRLMEISFEVLQGAEGKSTPITLCDVDLNDSLPVDIHNGSVIVSPSTTRLLQNYPNPFNPDTWIPYQLCERAHVYIRIYDILGRTVREMDLGEQGPGVYLDRGKAAYWDGRDRSGCPVSSGVYLYQLQAGSYTDVRRMCVVK